MEVEVEAVAAAMDLEAEEAEEAEEVAVNTAEEAAVTSAVVVTLGAAADVEVAVTMAGVEEVMEAEAPVAAE